MSSIGVNSLQYPKISVAHLAVRVGGRLIPVGGLW